jgi:hypothetical protein
MREGHPRHVERLEYPESARMGAVARRRIFNSPQENHLLELKKRRAHLRVRAARLRALVTEIEKEIPELDTIINNEEEQIATAAAAQDQDLSARVKNLLDQNIAPSLIADGLRVPRAQVTAIIEALNEATRLRRARFPERD